MTRELAGVGSAAALLTAIVCWPVVRSPQTLIFGNEIVGRHADPFVVMQQFSTGQVPSQYWQPVTDVPGALLAQVVGPIAAYNVLVLLTFPLTVLAAYALGRALKLGRVGAAIAGLGFAFAPVHVEQAGYHPHIAQTQWLPLYFLALIACVERPTIARAALLAASTAALALSNFYAGFIGLVVTIVALPAWWWAATERPWRWNRRVAVPLVTLLTLGAAGCLYVRLVAPQIWERPQSVGANPADLVEFSAKWWAYLVPSVEHPLFGEGVRRWWARTDVTTGLLEQQVSISWGLLALGGLGVAVALAGRGVLTRRWALALSAMALWAWFCSLAPHTEIGTVALSTPSAFLYSHLPMFRAYARFGIVVALMTALVAGAGADWLISLRSRVAGLALVVFLAIAVVDSVPLTWRARDVLPTSAHRWLADHSTKRALDCTAASPAETQVPWLMHDRLTMRTGALNDCTDPVLPTALAALGYAHVIVRGSAGRPLVHQVAGLEGLALVRAAPDAQVFAVTAPTPVVATVDVTGFHDREGDAGDAWRWMGSAGSWFIVNTSDRTVSAQVEIDLSAFPRARHVRIDVDRRELDRVLDVGPERARQTIGPLTLTPGEHLLSFRSVEPASSPDAEVHNGDTRFITLRFGHWQWHVLAS